MSSPRLEMARQYGIDPAKGMWPHLYSATANAVAVAALSLQNQQRNARIRAEALGLTPPYYAPDRESWPWTEAQWQEYDRRKRLIDRFALWSWAAAGATLLVAFGPTVVRWFVWWWR